MRVAAYSAFAWAVLVLGIVAAAAELMAQQKAPIPDAKAQEVAQKAVRDLYGERFEQAKTAAEKTALAKEMIEAAVKVEGGSADQYALLKIARDVAAAAVDVQTAIGAVGRLVERFDVPAAKLKAEVLLAAARKATQSAQHKAVAEAASGVIGELAASDDYETAIRLCEDARAAAQKARHYTLAKELTARAEDLKKQQEAAKGYRDALVTLDKDPIDPAANLTAGRYLCFVRGDFERGVSMLALGSDAELKALATKDLTGTAATDEQVALGDGWWALAESREGQEKESLMLRAGFWYRQAQPGLAAGLARVKIEKRLDEIEKLGREIQDSPAGPPLAVAPFNEKTARQHQARWAKHLKVPVVQTNSIGMKLVLIPPGEFDMGSTEQQVAQLVEEGKRQNAPGWYLERVPREAPRHRVKITNPLYLGQCEVTQGQYERVMGNNPSNFKGDANRPVEKVSWDDAVAFCGKLSQKEGKTYRLPTEAEWEYACRAGATTYYSFGDDAALLERHAWWSKNSQGRPKPVGQLQPNAWGLFDMHGNVWESCADWHDNGYYGKSPTDDPQGPSSGSHRVDRGGSCDDPAKGCRSANRNHNEPGSRHFNLGLRVSQVPADK